MVIEQREDCDAVQLLALKRERESYPIKDNFGLILLNCRPTLM